jgi:hypothetical protein
MQEQSVRLCAHDGCQCKSGESAQGGHKRANAPASHGLPRQAVHTHHPAALDNGTNRGDLSPPLALHLLPTSQKRRTILDSSQTDSRSRSGMCLGAGTGIGLILPG